MVTFSLTAAIAWVRSCLSPIANASPTMAVASSSTLPLSSGSGSEADHSITGGTEWP